MSMTRIVFVGCCVLLTAGSALTLHLERRQTLNSDSGNIGGVHQTTNNVGPLAGLGDVVKALPLDKPLLTIGRARRLIANSDSGNIGGVHQTTNNVGLFAGAADAIKALPLDKPLLSIGRERRLTVNSDSGNIGGVHQTTNNVGPLAGLGDVVKALPLDKPLLTIGRSKRGFLSIFCFMGIGCDNDKVINSDIGHVGGSYSTHNVVSS